MKNQVLLSIIFLFTLFVYQAQAQCPPGNVTLATQADVDDFVADYPMCQNLPGGIHIGGSGVGSPSDITDISGLQLTSVGGDLQIQHNPSLGTLDGLEMITSVSGGLSIFNNASLTSLTGLDALSSIGRNLSILNNDMLASLTGLNALTDIGTSLNISYNSALTSLTGLEGLTSISRFFTLESNGITSMAGLDNLESVGGSFTIKNNTGLLNLDGLESLTYVGGSLYLFANIQMTSILALSNLTDVCGIFQIFKNYNLTECAIGILCKFVLDENFDTFLDESMPVCGTVVSITDQLNAANTDCAAANANAVICDPLAAELISLDVRLEGRTAMLTWETATESNNQGFEIQRSKDGTNWETISWQEGSGNSTTLRTYSYKDYNTYRGINYYRLLQVDFGGSGAYSPAVSVTTFADTIDIYPNPASDILVVSGLDGRTMDEIIIHNISGKEVLRLTDTNNIVDISTLSPGMYVAVIVAGFDEKFLKLVIE